MAASKGFFVIRKVENIEGKRSFAGDLIIRGRADDPGEPPSGGPGPNFNIPRLELFEVKWILPPRNSPHYAASKAFAEGMGYDTVEHDDFSYPPPR